MVFFRFFQNVLRELEQKKPQLDDLVKTAENLRESPIRQQIPEKGKTKLDIILVTIAQSAKVPQKYAIQGSLYHFPQRFKVNVI